ncbi:MAG: aldehyde dehydrogenase family protein [Euryarchaeota archaeon]|nr:aldehyde dehydrogenase family protein [Euryarchaeota archaeon]
MAELVSGDLARRAKEILDGLGVPQEAEGVCSGPGTWSGSGATLDVTTPIDGSVIGTVKTATREDYDRVVAQAVKTFEEWRMEPAPKRGEVVRLIGDALRRNKDQLGALVTLEMGKILEEGKGEVQEAIDIADFATGLSRQLYGKTMHSEREHHRMYEQWHPAGPVGVITAFNFPIAVWAWNAMIALVCGDPVVWKPSPNVPLTAVAATQVCNEVLEEQGWTGLTNLVVGEADPVGEAMTTDKRLPVVSATGSTRMGKTVGPKVLARMGKPILELGGNNAIIVSDKADLDLAVPAIAFGAVGTAGQRCTSTRRVYVQKKVAKALTDRLVNAYRQVKIGNPLESGTLMGPLIDENGLRNVVSAIRQVEDSEGCEILVGGQTLPELGPTYIEPTIAKVPHSFPLLQEETFGPLLYIIEYDTLEQAIRWQNDVPQGLSSSIFTLDMREAETFLSHAGSDCGIANVNIGTSGAEIGGAFGGEKETGGGREAGSDSWKQYMRRQTNTINWSKELPLAQGIKFDLGE